MKKGIEWLKKAIGELDLVDTVFDVGGVSYIGTVVRVMQVYDLIDQLDEPEVLSQEENINIVLDDLKEHIKEQQELSKNVGLAHTSAGNDTHYRQYDFVLECIDEYEPSDELQNLIIPNQKPEVTLDEAFEKISELYPMTKEEIWKHLEQNAAYGGRVTYGEPEVLSQEWIDNNSINASSDGVTEEYVHVDDLQNLIIPKQEITEEQVMDWLDKNDFYDHITAETVLERVVDKGELSYYGTKYSVIKTPIIPQFVADWHKQNKYYLLIAKFKRIADWEDERVVNWYEKCTGRHGNNLANAQETIALMDLVGYEVEEEPLYHALIKGHELVHDDDIYWNYDKSYHDVFVSKLHPPHANFTTEMTEQEWFEVGINDSNADFIKVEDEEK